jgi:hypothetical protein
MKTKRAFFEIRELPGNIDETRTVTFIASSSKKDRHNTVLDLAGWDLRAYERNPIIGWMHDIYGDSLLKSPDPDSVIGKGRAYFQGQYLMIDITFEPAEINELAEKVFQKVKFGSIKATSVGFVPIEAGHWGIGDEARGGKNQTYYYGKRELLEVSICNIPSNSDSVIRKIEMEQLKEFTDEGKKDHSINQDVAIMDIKLSQAGLDTSKQRQLKKDLATMKLKMALSGVDFKQIKK